MPRIGKEIVCAFCGIKFNTTKTMQNKKYCSCECSIKGRKKGKIIKCFTCNKEFYVPNHRINAKYCSQSCLAKTHLSKYNKIYGFKKCNKPKRKYKTIITNDGKQIREHRYIMEQFLQRKLSSNEHVHHINGDSLDNRLENLLLLTNSEHQKLELKLRNIYS